MIFRLGALDTIADIVSSIGQFFKDIADFIVVWFRDLMAAVKLLGETTSMLTGDGSVINYFPGAVVSLFSVLLIIIVLYKVLGREG